MKIIHCSDLHLNSKNAERLQALEEILSLAEERKAELVLICGDLFDSSREAEKMRPVLRNLLSSVPFKILVIPGNHDMEAYRSDLNYGNGMQVLVEKPFGVLDFEGVRIVAIPYTNQNFSELMPSLEGLVRGDRINILMIHCSLDIPDLGTDEFGQEKRQTYLPVSSRMMAHTGFDYITAGHFHSRTVENKLSGRSTFLYSGSPVSITKKELGRRRVFLLDTNGRKSEQLKSLELDTFYYDILTLNFSPGKEDLAIGELKNRLKGYVNRKVDLGLDIGGFIAAGEDEIRDKILHTLKESGMYEKGVRMTENYRGVGHVLGDPLYISFKEKLKEKDLPEEFKEQIDEAVMLQFSSLMYKK